MSTMETHWKLSHAKCFWKLLLLFVVGGISFEVYRLQRQSSLQFPTVQTQRSDQSHRTQVILFWVPFFSMSDYGFGMGTNPFVDYGCNVTACETTNDRRRLPSSDAVLFHLSNMDMEDLPRQRWTNQRWLFFTMESPINTVSVKTNRYLSNLRSLDGQFNWTVTYRSDSDVVLPYFRTDMKRVRRKAPLQNDTKRRLVSWLVSNCATSGKREWYVSELRKHIGVDVYGRCGVSCPLGVRQLCKNIVFQGYKFYLSFENSICSDYTTEKLANALEHDIVPIVYGGADYSKVAPPNSYIDVRNFSSPRLLAKYLLQLDRNDTLYNEYFKWKSDYVISKGDDNIRNAFCDLCAKLHADKVPKVYDKLHDWWIGQGKCSREIIGYSQLSNSLRLQNFELSYGFPRTV